MNESNRRAGSSPDEMARLVGVVAALREHCPWTAALTHDSLTTYLLEESHELIEALETGHSNDIAAELGDILLQVVLHARLAEESGHFDVDDVARGLSEKLIRRSPHVFHADGTLQENFPATVAEIEETWERVKAEERADIKAEDAAGPGRGSRSEDGFSSEERAENLTASEGAPTSPPAPAMGPFAGIPRSLPALAMAQKSLERAARAGFAMPAVAAGRPGALPRGAVPLVAGPLNAEHIATEGELGKVLFDVVREAQQNGLDAERALRLAVLDFQRRPGTD